MKKIHGLTALFYTLAIVSILICVAVYSGVFDIGHGGVPLIVLFTSAPMALMFMVIYIVSFAILRKRTDAETKKSIGSYYISVALNIVINLITAYALFL